MIKRADLETLYWGPTRLPPDWNSVNEISELTGLDPEYVLKAPEGYGITIRSSDVDKHKYFWNVFELGFGMAVNKHFLYQTEMNHAPVDFYIIYESIGIKIDNSLPVYEIKTLHIGNGMIVKVGCSDPEKNAELLEQQLRDIGVKTKYVHDTEESYGEW